MDGNPYLTAFAKESPAIVTAMLLGRRAAALRESIGLTIAEAAARSGVSTTVIRNFEADGSGTVADLLAINGALSTGTADDVLATPRFGSVDEYQLSLERRDPR